MGAERERILKMLEDGKIDGNEATKLLALAEDEEEEKPGLYVLLFAFLPMIVAIAAGIGLLYCLFFYLPFHLPVEKMTIVYGLLAIIALCITLGWVVLMGVGKKAVSAKFKINKGDKQVEWGEPSAKKLDGNEVSPK